MLKDHYLLEDADMRDEALTTLIKTKSDIVQCMIEGNFLHVPQLMQQEARAVQVLEALHNKKVKRDLDQFHGVHVRWKPYE